MLTLRPPVKAPGPRLSDRLALRWSKGRIIDGLWVGRFRSDEEPALLRVEEALSLIKQRDQIQYARIVRNLKRVWVNLLPDARACFDRSLQACVLDERFVLDTAHEEIASAIIHEATHARLERYGITYEESIRPRVEAICLRRELSFLAKVPNCETLRDETAATLDRCFNDPVFLQDTSLLQRYNSGLAETLRHAGLPEWLIAATPKLQTAIAAARRLIASVARPKGR